MYPQYHMLATPVIAGMTGDPRLRHPAALNGRQRRRLTRRSNLPQSAAEAEGESPVAHTSIGAPYEAMRTATPPELSHSTVELSSPPRPNNASASPTPTSAGAPIADSASKKKFGLFTLNTTKDYDRSEGMTITSPLPPMTPSKAKQLLGFDPHDASTSRDTLDSPCEKVTSNRLSKFKEEEVKSDPPKKSSFWSSNNKALKILDMRPRHAKQAEDEESTSAQKEDSPGVSLEGLSMASRTDPQPSRRRRRKRGPKSLHRMAPITEMSHDALSTAYRNSESNTELDLISEYESPSTHSPRSAPFLPRSQTESVLNSLGPFTLSGGDMSPSDRDREEEKHDYMSHPGSQVDLNRLKWKQPDAPLWRSPLQRYESRLLDDIEEELIHHKVNLDRSDAVRMELDEEVAAMKRAHTEFKREFEAIKQQQSFAREQPARADEAESSDDDDMISISSSIDLDEEPVVCEARVMTFTVATGKVKPIMIVKRDANVAPLRKQSENSPLASPTHLRNTSYDRLTKDAKPKMPRNESQLLVQDWVTKYDRNEQRPVSERIDPDVLADQEIPPAPFPKDEPVSPHPPRLSSRYHCLQNGHIFRAINLRQVPDEVSINSLEVRPYLRTHSGIKQHVHVPVPCGRCGEDVDEKIWECEVPICHIAVCGLCAVNMQIEREERAVASRMH